MFFFLRVDLSLGNITRMGITVDFVLFIGDNPYLTASDPSRLYASS
jgi:hypothetical protein